ncbi:MAG TPA: DNA alkylation repair protein [Dysgonamonadaceae bacterium]|nr:DNA alkylation repair protein [Dysgonamonadaceae bacterium]
MMDELVRNIRNDLRLAMNGVASSSMRDKGVDYKMNFGVDVPSLQRIALKYKPNSSLAEEIWELDVREMKILSTMLYPVDQLSEAKANEWVKEIPNQETREHLCRNLLQNLSFSHKLVEKWTIDTNPSIRLTGFWLYVRLMLINSDALQKVDSHSAIGQALQDIKSESGLLRTGALNVLKHVIRRDEKSAEVIMKEVSSFSTSDNPVDREIYENLRFEFELRR